MDTYTKSDIFDILDKRIKETMQNKNEYIKKNGFSHKETLQRFDTIIATISFLYYDFK